MRLVNDIDDPPQSDLRRSISTLYYAMFHELAEACANHLVGQIGIDTSDNAWIQTYRALDHFHVRTQCEKSYFKRSRFPTAIKDFAAFLIEMQRKRHEADYDPVVTFQKSEFERDLRSVRDAVLGYRATSEKHRRAFSIFVMLKSRDVNGKKPPSLS